ncbi:apoptosis-antagonizing transcription factor [Amylocarpus encephaloides]|uniref:Protein BFR2 n=1 Tax=Amylocarpus encephaloides TaxID=45428 RepID=A0A9P7YKH1_9HELO|nr:apoptosis-antagonizing transcription factor [Amylocarpus encephaloides]
MGTSRTRAQHFVESAGATPKDFDPEEDNAPHSSGESNSKNSDDGLAGTEHYAEVSKSKLRKLNEIALGPKYAGSRITRHALLNGDGDSDELSEAESESEAEQEQESPKFAHNEDFDLDVDDEDGDIDSDAAFGESGSEKFGNFASRGSGKPRYGVVGKKRHTAADFMIEEDAEGARQIDVGEMDEGILDTAETLFEDSEIEVFSTARQYVDESDSEQFGNGVTKTGSSDEVVTSSEGSEADGTGDDNQSPHEDEDDGDDDEITRRAELRRIMNDEHKTVVATISQAAKADAAKGNAVKEQRKAFDSLLSVRMVLQKALTATNSMSAVEEKEQEDNQPYEAAEQAAVKLWRTLDGLRNELAKATVGTKAGQKRKRGLSSSTISAIMWDKMQEHEVSRINLRQTTLEKWSAKLRGASALPLTRKLNPGTTQSITSVLQDQLASSDHLVRKTKVPRSCAPLQRDQKKLEDSRIYDDGNFYQLLLKELVDQRRVESMNVPVATSDSRNALQWTAVNEVKTKKNVDTKASKGRKMRYTVHEKLQNFMAPEGRGAWEPEAIDRFFGTLLGQKMTLAEDVEQEGEDDKAGLKEDELKLFRSS